MSELAPLGHFVSWIPLERLPALESSGGTDDFGCEFDFSIEWSGCVDSQKFGSVLDERG